MNVSDLSSLTPLANHLWQSTVCAGAIWLLTLALKNNRAAVRYWLWFAASAKFLSPFSFLMALGSELSWRTAAPIIQPRWSFVVDNAVQPFAASAAPPQVVSTHAWFTLTPILIAVWLCGVAIGLAFWLKCWMQMRRIRKSATPLPLGLPIPALSSPSQIEPGVFGIFRPVLLLPEGIESRLTSSQLDAVVAHEMAHVRRRDNLTAAIHMLVETLFWFFPLIWWIRVRLVEEREHACDEAVLQRGGDAEAYASGIIEVCKSYVGCPTVCVSGISGYDLKKRILHIVTQRLTHELTFAKKAMLSTLSLAAITGPLVLGVVDVPLLRAQSPQTQPATGAPLPSFEVASVKPSEPSAHGSTYAFVRGGGIKVTNGTVKGLIEMAYDVRDFQISGGPGWVNSSMYDILAKNSSDDDDSQSDNSSVSIAQTRLRVQALLAQRFHLKVDQETKELPVYVLTLGKGGPKLTDGGTSKLTGPAGIRTSCGQMIGTNASMGNLVLMLSRQLQRPVLDHTGAEGKYDFQLLWTPDFGPCAATPSTDDTSAAAVTPSEYPSLFTALQEQLGLKLDSTKGPVETIVIDHIEEPTPN